MIKYQKVAKYRYNLFLQFDTMTVSGCFIACVIVCSVFVKISNLTSESFVCHFLVFQKCLVFGNVTVKTDDDKDTSVSAVDYIRYDKKSSRVKFDTTCYRSTHLPFDIDK